MNAINLILFFVSFFNYQDMEEQLHVIESDIKPFKSLLRGDLVETLNFINSNTIQIFLSSTFTGN